MAKLSSSNGLEKRPKLRFPGFDEPYKQCRIGDIYAERSQRGASNMELLSVTMNDGVKPRSEIEGKDNSSEDKSNYKIVRKGDMVYNSMRMWQGANGISPCDGIVSPAYTVLMPKQEINNGYFAALFKSANLINEFRKNSQGMTSDTWNLKYPQIETIKIQIPSVSEQDKVSELFGVLDARIVAQAQLIEALKKYKRGLSNKLFEDYSNNWIAANFADVFKLLQNNTFSRAELTCEETEILNIHYGDVLIKYGDILDLSKVCDIPFIKNNIDLKRYSETSYLKNGDIVIADTAEDYTVGKTIEIFSASGKRILSGLHTIPCRSLIPFEAKYLGYYLNSYSFRKQILPLIQGTKVSSISKSELQKVKVKYPEPKEQKRIVSILSLIDEKIYIAEHQLTFLKICKDGLLQQMFI